MWMISLDLKDAHLHIHIPHCHRHFLAFKDQSGIEGSSRSFSGSGPGCEHPFSAPARFLINLANYSLVPSQVMTDLQVVGLVAACRYSSSASVLAQTVFISPVKELASAIRFPWTFHGCLRLSSYLQSDPTKVEEVHLGFIHLNQTLCMLTTWAGWQSFSQAPFWFRWTTPLSCPI